MAGPRRGTSQEDDAPPGAASGRQRSSSRGELPSSSTSRAPRSRSAGEELADTVASPGSPVVTLPLSAAALHPNSSYLLTDPPPVLQHREPAPLGGMLSLQVVHPQQQVMPPMMMQHQPHPSALHSEHAQQHSGSLLMSTQTHQHAGSLLVSMQHVQHGSSLEQQQSMAGLLQQQQPQQAFQQASEQQEAPVLAAVTRRELEEALLRQMELQKKLHEQLEVR
jgi:hypothetical protein